MTDTFPFKQVVNPADSFIATAFGLPFMLIGLWLGGRRFVRPSLQDVRRFASLLPTGLSVAGLLKSGM